MNCDNCIYCSLDGIYCHLLHRPTEPVNSCHGHIEGSLLQTALRKLASKECSKKNV